MSSNRRCCVGRFRVAVRDVLLSCDVTVRITGRCHEVVDGVQLDRFEVGLIYDVNAALASYLIASRCAEAVIEDEVEHAKQEEQIFRVNVKRWRKVAADVSRRRR